MQFQRRKHSPLRDQARAVQAQRHYGRPSDGRQTQDFRGVRAPLEVIRPTILAR